MYGGAPTPEKGAAHPHESHRMATDWSDNIVIAELADEPSMSEELNNILQRLSETQPSETPHVVLNLADATYLNSSNIAQLLRLRKGLTEAGRKLKLCCVSDQVWSIILLTGLDTVFNFAPDTVTAIASLQIEDEGGQG